MKYINKSALMGGVLLVFATVLSAGEGWGQQEYEQARQDLLNGFDQAINLMQQLAQELTPHQLRQLTIQTLFPHVEPGTSQEALVLFFLLGEGNPKKGIREIQRWREIWRKHPYAPEHEGELVHLLQEYLRLTAESMAVELAFSEEAPNIPSDQVVRRFLQFLEEKKALKQQLENLMRDFSFMD